MYDMKYGDDYLLMITIHKEAFSEFVLAHDSIKCITDHKRLSDFNIVIVIKFK